MTLGARFHPVEDSLWNDPKFDATGELPVAEFEERAFFVFLMSNERQKPSGIYRATDEQFHSDTRIPVTRVHLHLCHLHVRRLIVRDGSWLFVRGYFKRVPKGPHLLYAAKQQVETCTSLVVLEAFAEQYPLYRQWSSNGQATIAGPLLRVGNLTQNLKYPERNWNGTRTGTGTGTQNTSLTSTIPAPVAEHPGVDAVAASPPAPPTETPDSLREVWNEYATKSRAGGLLGLVVCRDLTAKRRTKATQRLEESELSWHRQAIERLSRSTFARGGSKTGWRASFEWYVQSEDNTVKCMEGKYDDQT